MGVAVGLHEAICMQAAGGPCTHQRGSGRGDMRNEVCAHDKAAPLAHPVENSSPKLHPISGTASMSPPRSTCLGTLPPETVHAACRCVLRNCPGRLPGACCHKARRCRHSDQVRDASRQQSALEHLHQLLAPPLLLHDRPLLLLLLRHAGSLLSVIKQQ